MDLLFHALSDATRRRILEELAERREQTLYELCVRLLMRHQVAMSRQALAKHLGVLERAGLVRTRRNGKYKVVAFDRRALAAGSRWLRALEAGPRET